MEYCIKCGAKLTEKAEFCTKCGTPIKSQDKSKEDVNDKKSLEEQIEETAEFIGKKAEQIGKKIEKDPPAAGCDIFLCGYRPDFAAGAFNDTLDGLARRQA